MLSAPSPQNLQAVTVSQLTAQVKDSLEDAFVNLWVVGEVSNLKPASSGHVYFNLKDKDATLRIILWRSDAARLRFPLRDGLEIVVHGRLTVYPPRGDYSLQIDRIIAKGLGEQDLALRQLKERLQAQGFFARERKKPIPHFPRRVALVTSPTGAAIRDMLEILARRWPQAEVLVCPVPFQGSGAAEDMAQALEKLNRLLVDEISEPSGVSRRIAQSGGLRRSARQPIDVIILGRGGGSSDDLAAFNAEILARAIFHSKIPIISAVGHEIDVTIADLVADRRALTPSEAAELATPDRHELLRHLDDRSRQLRLLMRGRLESLRKRLQDAISHRVFRRPKDSLRSHTMRLDELAERLVRAQKQRLDQAQHVVQHFAGQLQSLSPLNVLTRGYSLTRTEKERQLIRSASQVRPGDRVEIVVSDGRLLAAIEEVSRTPLKPQGEVLRTLGVEQP